MLRFFDRANALTLVGLAAAVVGVVLSARGLVSWAVVALVASGFCDGLDGMLARRLPRTDEQRRFGAHLDTIVDACAFGIAPTALLHAAGLRSPPEVAVLVLFAACAAWRLAYFDTVGLADEGGRRSYTGLPTTFTAIVLPAALLAGHWGAEALRVAGNVAGVGMALAMVAPVRVPKPGGKATAVIAVLALGLAALWVRQGLITR
ncbi:MAG: CDP-alcohol phosphatidyltransferase family protein [Planctomycetes bacterium]|nr:CDP-alcohol phosphatidyltransferase family protein [Planctomycetota bacterium]